MDPVALAEQVLKSTAAELTTPQEAECLYHYLCRMLDQHGCRGHRFTERWAKQRRLRGPVLKWAIRSGGCCCDCEVVMNSFGSPASCPPGLLCAQGLVELEHPDEAEEDW